MGEQGVSIPSDPSGMQRFVKNLLNDVKAFDHMLEQNWFEDDVIRIGSEQELCLIDKKTYKPLPIAMEVLAQLNQFDWLETELAKFNLEINSQPKVFEGNCIRALEQETLENLGILRETLKSFQSDFILTGILPTLRKWDLELHNLTPKPRYKALIDAINSQMTGSYYELRLMGIDELLVKHDSPLLEACNTSFQVHLQVRPADFVYLYNISQALAAPVMAIAANSPIVFGKRLWHESRIALFQQALDTRSTSNYMRQRSPRVSFGSGWLESSVLEIYKEDIGRFRALLSGDTEEDSLEKIRNNQVPKLRALQIHNSTVYRWNRPCYGISSNGKPHLRIENRVLPAGPTVIDEMANAAFWLGAMTGMLEVYGDIRKNISWEDVRDNMTKAAKIGIDSAFTWTKDQKIGACELVLKELLPIARQGLMSRNVDLEDIDRYLGIIEERAKHHMTGARWQLRAFTSLMHEVNKDEALTVLTSSMNKNQINELPVHQWPLPKVDDLDEYNAYKLLVDEFMETDIFTVQKDDIVELVAELMHWRNIRYMPVEDSKGNMSGLVTSSNLIRHLVDRNSDHPTMVKEIMIENPITIEPSATINEAMQVMRRNEIGCLPVVKEGELIGMITETEFLKVSSRLIERLEK